MYGDANNLYGWTNLKNNLLMVLNGQKNTLNFDENFIKNGHENSDKGYIFEVDVEYPKKLHETHNDLPFLSERMKMKKCFKVFCNMYDVKKYVAHIKTLKQTLNHELILKKVYRAIQFNQKAWLK